MSEWISVEDRLPDVIGCYLVCSYELHARVVGWTFFNSQKRWTSNKGDYKDVTHWMPLPKPPTTEERGR